MARASGQAAFAGLVYVVLVVATAVAPITGQVREPEGPPITFEEFQEFLKNLPCIDPERGRKLGLRAKPWKFLGLLPGVSSDRQVKELLGSPTRVVRHTFSDGLETESWEYRTPEPCLKSLVIGLDPATHHVDSIWAVLLSGLSGAELEALFGPPWDKEGGGDMSHLWHFITSDGQLRFTWIGGKSGFDTLWFKPCQPGAVVRGEDGVWRYDPNYWPCRPREQF